MAFHKSTGIIGVCEQDETLRYIFRVLDPFVEIVNSHPPWQEVLSVSQKEGLSFLLYKGIIKRGIDMPPLFRETLKREYIKNWIRNVRIFEELAALLQVFGYPVIILKGAYLLSSLYDSPGLRSIGDVDVLVRVEDAPQIDKTLSRLGYRPDHRLRSYNVSDHLNSLLYGKNGSPLLLHLHWHIVNNALPNYVYADKINMEKLWSEAVSLKVQQSDALCLAPHHQILHISEHAMKHSYNTLIHIWDIQLIINRWKGSLDWERICREAREFQLHGALFYSLWLCKEYLGASLPEEVLESLRPKRKGIGERIFFRLLRQGKRKEKFCCLFYFSNISGWRKKAKFIFHALCPPMDALVYMEGVEIERQKPPGWKVIIRRLRKTLRFFSRTPYGYND